MILSQLVSDYFNKECAQEAHSTRLLTLLMEYWAAERDHEVKSELLKQMVFKYSVAERKLAELNLIKNKFLGLAAHDFRNPLVLIRGLSEILRDELGKTLHRHQKEYLDTIYLASSTMLTLVNDFLDVSAIENQSFRLQIRHSSLQAVLRERLKIYRMLAAKKSIRLTYKLSRLPDFPFDRDRIAQVVDNLLGNAIKFSPPEKNIHVSMNRKDGKAVVSVRDEGPGIPTEKIQMLFKEYQTFGTRTTGEERSTGLGLAIVKRIVDEHSGDISVSGVVGSGSIFTFSIPMECGYDDGKKAQDPACGG